MKAISYQLRGPAAYTRHAPPIRYLCSSVFVKPLVVVTTPLVVRCSDSLHPPISPPEASCNQSEEPVIAHVQNPVTTSAWHPAISSICSWASNHRVWLAAAVGVAALGLMPIMVGAHAPAGLATAPFASISWADWAMERSIVIVGKVSGLNIAAKICLVLASTLPAVVAFGALYSSLTSTDMKSSCVKMYALLNKLPGMAVLNEKTLPAALLVNFAFILGTFVFAIMLGMVTEEVKTQFKNFRNGKYQMHQEGHVVLLNWNQQTVHTLRAIAAARKAGQGGMFDRPVAVLSDTPKAEMDSTIQKRLKGVHLEIITRTGSPSTPGDLASVALAQAAAVIVHTPEHTPGAYGGAWPAHGAAAQVAVALAAASPNIANQNIIFQSPPEHGTALEHVTAFKRLIKLGDTTQVMKYSDEDLVNRTVTVSAVQPGMQRVMAQLMAQPGCRIQSIPPSLAGCTYQHARRMFADGVLCGVMRGQVVDLLVPETYVLKANEQLIMLSPSPEDVPVNPKAEPIFQRAAENVKGRLAGHIPYKSQPRHICIISPAADKTQGLVEVLSELAPRGSVVTFLTPKGSSGPSKKGNCTYKYLSLPSSADACVSGHLLKEAGIHDATAVMVYGLEDLSPNAADAYVTSTLLQVQDSVRQSGRLDAPHFVAQIRKASTQTSISTFLNLIKKEARASGANANQIINKPDLFLSDDMCGSILAHAAYQPAFAHLVMDMLDSQGAEVYIRSPQAYNIKQGDLLMFADVAETTRAFNETAIGIIRADGAFTLAPEPTYPLNLQAGDKIISLAEDYSLKRA